MVNEGRPDLWTLGLLSSNGRRMKMKEKKLPPWLQKHSKTKSEKEEPAHKGKKGSYASQEKKEHGGKLPSKKEEMAEKAHAAKETAKARVSKTERKMRGK